MTAKILLSMIDTWYHSDVSDNPVFNGQLEAALGAIAARTIIMPATTDLYFTEEDSEAETKLMKNAELALNQVELGASGRQSAAQPR